jgi:rod shape-determining protein MreC
VPDVGRNRSEIARLQQQNLLLQRELADQRVDASTAARLKALQLQSDAAGWTTMPARVLATGPGAGFEWTVTVDVGRRENIAVGQTVTDGYGLVGRVVSVLPTTSVIMLAADPTFGVGARDLRSGTLLLASGRAEAGMTGTALQDKADVRAGDQLATGPAGQSTFVPGIAIGTVTGVSTAADGTLSVSIRPSAPQTGLNLVGIVLTQTRTTGRTAIGTGR